MTQDFYFETGLAVLFNEPEINAGEPGEQVLAMFDGLPKITLFIADINSNNVFLFAHHVWKASILLSKIIQNFDLNGCDCLELGAGTGLVSIVASHLNANIVASDYPSKEIIHALNLNLSRNCKREFKVIGHKWGDPLHLGTFDYIFLADTLWIQNEHDNLLFDIRRFLKPNGTVLLCCGLHTGYHVVESFLSKARNWFQTNLIGYYRIPIENGLAENVEWPLVDEISDSIEHRKNFLLVYSLKKIYPG